MRKRRVGLLALVGALLLALTAGAALAQGGGGTATAELEDPDGNPVGDAEFVEGPNGVNITVNVREGVEPGEHGIHVHETGEVSPDFEAAGEHFNPTDDQHGTSNPEGPHAGDLENITITESGTTTYTTTTDRISLSGGEGAILDSDGSTLVIHSEADDYETDPSGQSGDPVAAGVIERSSEPLPSSGGIGLLPVTALAALAALGMLVAAGVLVRRRA